MTRLALATVVSDEFLAGALVMIDSFRCNNPWFSGDVAIIHDQLSQQSRDVLASCFPDLIMHEISAELGQRMSDVRRAAGWTGNKHLQFGSLEVFALEGYDQVIFCDSDLLFLNTVNPLLARKSALVCCGDGTHFRGNRRRMADFVEVSGTTDDGRSDSIANTFNSGLMIFRPELVGRTRYNGLLDMMEPDRWAGDVTGHTDQMVLNLYFAGQQELASPIYNYMLSHRDLIACSTGVGPDQARVLHFTGPQKPWLPIGVSGAGGVDQHYFIALKKWRSALERLDRRLGFDLLDRLGWL